MNNYRLQAVPLLESDIRYRTTNSNRKPSFYSKSESWLARMVRSNLTLVVTMQILNMRSTKPHTNTSVYTFKKTAERRSSETYSHPVHSSSVTLERLTKTWCSNILLRSTIGKNFCLRVTLQIQLFIYLLLLLYSFHASIFVVRLVIFFSS